MHISLGSMSGLRPMSVTRADVAVSGKRTSQLPGVKSRLGQDLPLMANLHNAPGPDLRDVHFSVGFGPECPRCSYLGRSICVKPAPAQQPPTRNGFQGEHILDCPHQCEQDIAVGDLDIALGKLAQGRGRRRGIGCLNPKPRRRLATAVF